MGPWAAGLAACVTVLWWCAAGTKSFGQRDVPGLARRHGFLGSILLQGAVSPQQEVDHGQETEYTKPVK